MPIIGSGTDSFNICHMTRSCSGRTYDAQKQKAVPRITSIKYQLCKHPGGEYYSVCPITTREVEKEITIQGSYLLLSSGP